MLKVVFTLILVLAVIVLIIKQVNATTAMLTVSITALVILTIIEKTSVLGEKSIGNIFLDIVMFIVSTTQTQIAGNTLNILLILGYVGLMNYMKGTEIFATAAASLLKFIKQKYLLAGALVILVACVKLFIGSSIAVVSLLIAVLYPVLLKCGCSKATIASALLCGTVITWGPTDPGVMITVTLTGGIDINDYFTAYQVPNKLIVLAVMCVVFIFTSIYWDKKDNAEGGDASFMEEKKLSDIKAPKFLGIYPAFPLLFVLLFNGKIFPWTLSFPGATTLSLIISFVTLLIITRKPFTQRFGEFNEFYKEAGKTFGNVGFILVGATLFAGVITRIGGLAVISDFVAGIGGGGLPLIILVVFLGFIVVGCTVSFTGNLNIFIPFAVSIAKATGMDIYRIAEAAQTGCGIGSGITPASTTMLLIVDYTGLSYPIIFKRVIIPFVAGLITTTAFAAIVG